MPPRATPLPLPADVRLMNLTAQAVFTLAAVVLVSAVAAWAARQPVFTLKHIRLEGDVARNSVATIRANAAPRLLGNYFSMDLDAARAAFEAVPWVRQAVVHRVWPNQLVVRLEEHHPVALWKGDDGNDRLVNSHGEVFEANLGDVDEDSLPQFSGADEDAPALLAMYHRLRPELRPLDAEPSRLTLSHRGSWQLLLDNGAELDLGRGSEDEIAQRVRRFTQTITQVVARQQRDWVRADLRHADGYALSFKASLALAASAAASTNPAARH